MKQGSEENKKCRYFGIYDKMRGGLNNNNSRIHYTIPQYTIKEANDLIHERQSGVYLQHYCMMALTTALLHDGTYSKNSMLLT
jgi:hypothetical protein